MKRLVAALGAFLLMVGVMALPAAAAAPDKAEGFEVLMPFDPVPAPDARPADGESTITRTSNGMSLHWKVEGLDPNHVYSVWWLIAADVEKVDGECGPTAIFELNATGAVANKHGKATFSAHLSTGAIGPVNDIDILTNTGDGVLDDPLRNHVVTIAVDHGDKHDLDGNVAQNMYTILGALEFPGAVDLIHDNPSQWIRDNC